MAMSFASAAATTTTSSSQLLVPVHRLSRRKLPTAVPSLSFPLRPHRCLPFSALPPEPPRFSHRTHSSSSSSSRTPTDGLLSPIISTSRTLLFLLVASLLSLSGVRPLPSLASLPPPTQQPQEETEGQEEQQGSQEGKQQEGPVEKEEGVEAEVDEEEEEAEELLRQRQEEEGDEEVRMYLDVLSSDPGDVDALKCVLFAKMRRADWGDALGFARRLREAEPGEVEWRLMEALLHELKGDLGEAERLFREVLAEKPLLVRALHGLALCMHKRSEGPTVFEMLENALQLAISEEKVPEERNIKLLIAQMHVVKGQLDAASEKLQNLINEDPRDFRPHLCQGIVYALLDKKEEADELFDTYRSLVPDEFPDKSFITDVIQAARMESKDRLQKDFGPELLSKK
ncbi:protein SLOW GREEN 1, chloroplastic-like isoform X2 [Oryza brachyantha]|nr:protein SLOW GREEN 1, chloroplastic-like isoform X2 [Oryza brachyantha]